MPWTPISAGGTSTMAMSAQGGTELSKLIKSMNPTPHDGTFVFATIETSDACNQAFLQQAASRAEMLFREDEGLTIIITQAIADELGIDFIFPSRRITLNVHSSLEAVGLIAAVATRLASVGISCNTVAGYYHDHIFVPVGKETLAMEELKAMAAEQL